MQEFDAVSDSLGREEAHADATTMRIFAVANQRAVSARPQPQLIGCRAAERDKRVLIVDLDPQGNATTDSELTAAIRTLGL